MKEKGKCFDVALMNPPYGSVGGDTLHLKFVDKVLDMADMQIVVMPFGFVTKDTKPFKKYKEKFSNYLTNIEEYSSSIFQGTGFPNVAIYEIDMNKKPSTDINIQYLDGHNDNVCNLLNISNFSDYEKNIIKYLEDNGQQPMSWAGGKSARLNTIIGKSIEEVENIKTNNCINSCKEAKKMFNIYKSALIVNADNGGMNATFMSKLVGQIFDNYKSLENFFLSRKPGNNIIFFNSRSGAENCLEALKHPLLRFTCHKMQKDQHMPIKTVYKYVPNIDWEDDRVLTDEGLLEVCGCPKDKAREYAEYCKKYIEENVDKDNRK